jgi:hypothetical protein
MAAPAHRPPDAAPETRPSSPPTAGLLAEYALDANDVYFAGRYAADCARLAGEDARLPEPRRRELATRYAGQAAEFLRAAVTHGFKDTGRLRKAPDLDPLRDRDDFKKLLADVES